MHAYYLFQLLMSIIPTVAVSTTLLGWEGPILLLNYGQGGIGVFLLGVVLTLPMILLLVMPFFTPQEARVRTERNRYAIAQIILALLAPAVVWLSYSYGFTTLTEAGNTDWGLFGVDMIYGISIGLIIPALLASQLINVLVLMVLVSRATLRR